MLYSAGIQLPELPLWDCGPGPGQKGAAVDQIHTTTGTPVYLAVYWVTHAAATAFALATLGAALFYLGWFALRLIRRLSARRDHG